MERIGTLVVAPTTDRKAEPGRFSEALRSAAAETVNGIAGTLNLAAPYLPGGAVLAGALRTTVPAPPAPGPTTGAGTAPGAARPTALAAGPATPAPSPALPSALAPALGAAAATPSASGSGGDLMEATRVLQQQSQSFNLQYLQLQESLQRESREFTALSNVMKVRHESAKAAIGNIH